MLAKVFIMFGLVMLTFTATELFCYIFLSNKEK